MVLRALKAKFKVKSGLKFLEKELRKPSGTTQRKKGITTIGCIVDLDKFDKASVFEDFIDDFALRPNAIKVIGYKNYYDKNSPYATPVFSDKDLGWGGAIENSYALEFMSREYDLLVNYYNEDKLLLQLMTIKTKARIKVGFGEVDQKLNDLILHTSILDFKVFKKELKKYLKVLKEI